MLRPTRPSKRFPALFRDSIPTVITYLQKLQENNPLHGTPMKSRPNRDRSTAEEKQGIPFYRHRACSVFLFQQALELAVNEQTEEVSILISHKAKHVKAS